MEMRPQHGLAKADLRSLNELEAVVDRYVDSYIKVGLALIEIKDRELYKAYEDTWEAYISKRWPMRITKRHADRIIAASKAALSVNGLELHPSSGVGQRDIECPAEEGPAEGVLRVGVDVVLDQTGAERLGTIDDEAERANVLAEAAKHGKWRNGVMVITSSAVKKAQESSALPSPQAELVDEDDEPEQEFTPEEWMTECNQKLESACRTILTAFKCNIEPLATENEWLNVFGRADTAKQGLKNCLQTIRSCKGAGVCPVCNGDGCPRCHHMGFLDASTMSQVQQSAE